MDKNVFCRKFQNHTNIKTTKLLIFIILVMAVGTMKAYDFQSGNLLYTIISTAPPCVTLDGHVDGQAAQGELVIPALVEHR